MTDLIFKIILPDEWKAAEQAGVYSGSSHDKADGFLHFSTAPQLPDTLRLYYADASSVVIAAVDAGMLGSTLKYEHSPSRDDAFPHLYGQLYMSAVVSTLYKPMRMFPGVPDNGVESWLTALKIGERPRPNETVESSDS